MLAVVSGAAAMAVLMPLLRASAIPRCRRRNSRRRRRRLSEMSFLAFGFRLSLLSSPRSSASFHSVRPAGRTPKRRSGD